MPKFSQEFTAGNLASIITTVIAVGTLVWYASSAITELRQKDQMHDERISRLETEGLRSRADHDILIEIRQDLRLLRQQFETQPRRSTGSIQ